MDSFARNKFHNGLDYKEKHYCCIINSKRSASNLQPLKGLASCLNNKKLKIFETDPFDYESIINALKDCSALFYTFETPQEQPIFDEFMAEIEVRAAHNVLEACAQTNTMEKVIFTSSVTAVIWGEDHKSTTADEELSERNLE
ncbi:cinnamoyl-CoA reductase-like SNL6 [Papaver somniferum]|uniref:cinnamoyl-CoA reductase-like SNL6 n=1 Tax=Papaver somniferum TaxID=3469 RepID=UPI000E6FA91A|nr:cinnamoyl-CoA reductase-like SNL6 [Papaver somniferum]